MTSGRANGNGPAHARRGRFTGSCGFWCSLAMAIGIALGHFYPDAGVRMEPLSDAFIRAIRVLIAPIIFCTVVHGIASMADMAKVGRVALKALIYFEVLTTIALVIGLVAVNVFQPGAGMNVDVSHIDTSSIAPYSPKPIAGPPRNFCSASFPTPSSAPSAKATCCRSFMCRCCAALP